MLKLPRLTLPTLTLPTLFPRRKTEARKAVPLPQVKPVSFRLSVAPPAAKMLQVGHGGDGSRFELEHKPDTRDVIFAQSGMGKSYLTGILVEQTLECGGVVFIADPEGEYHTLKERYPVLVVGGDHSSIGMDLDTAEDSEFQRLSDIVLKEGASVVFDLSGRTYKSQQELFIRMTGALFSALDFPENRRHLKLISDEARLFAPQMPPKEFVELDGMTSLSVLVDVATRGRKRGLDFLIATQRPAGLNKDVSAQANRIWFGGVKSIQDCKALKPYLDEAGISPEQIRALTPGHFYCYANGRTTLVKIGKRKCSHGGSTPSMGNKPVASRERLKEIAAKL